MYLPFRLFKINISAAQRRCRKMIFFFHCKNAFPAYIVGQACVKTCLNYFCLKAAVALFWPYLQQGPLWEKIQLELVYCSDRTPGLLLPPTIIPQLAVRIWRCSCRVIFMWQTGKGKREQREQSPVCRPVPYAKYFCIYLSLASFFKMSI